jgi:hypothetical protein
MGADGRQSVLARLCWGGRGNRRSFQQVSDAPAESGQRYFSRGQYSRFVLAPTTRASRGRSARRSARRSVSRVLSAPYGRGDHSSGTRLATRLSRPTRTTGRESPCVRLRATGAVVPIRSCSRWGLPCRPCCQGRGALLPHRFALARGTRRRTGHTCAGGLFSVALSLGSPPPAVSRHRLPVEPGLSSDPRVEPEDSGRPTVWQAPQMRPGVAPVKRASPGAGQARFARGGSSALRATRVKRASRDAGQAHLPLRGAASAAGDSAHATRGLSWIRHGA